MSEEKDLQQILKSFEAQHAQKVEPQGFKPDQMLKCEKCDRANPPTRSNCLYCGANLPLPATETTLKTLQKPKLKQMESWEQGFNIVLVPQQKKELSEKEIFEVAKFLNLSTNNFKRIIQANQALPLVQASTHAEAILIQNGLKHLCVEVCIVSDKDMFVENAPGRLRGLSLEDSSIKGRDLVSDNAMSLSWEEIRLIVVGRVIERRIETEEKVSRKEIKELTDSREFNTDQMQLDIYGGDHPLGWRVVSDKFDFSCLGRERSLVASKNFELLANRLRLNATNAAFDDAYNRVQSVLNLVWLVEQRNESLGLKRKNFGQMLSQHASVSSNEMQFLRYSRLRSFLNAHGI